MLPDDVRQVERHLHEALAAHLTERAVREVQTGVHRHPGGEDELPGGQVARRVHPDGECAEDVEELQHGRVLRARLDEVQQRDAVGLADLLDRHAQHLAEDLLHLPVVLLLEPREGAPLELVQHAVVPEAARLQRHDLHGYAQVLQHVRHPGVGAVDDVVHAQFEAVPGQELPVDDRIEVRDTVPQSAARGPQRTEIVLGRGDLVALVVMDAAARARLPLHHQDALALVLREQGGNAQPAQARARYQYVKTILGHRYSFVPSLS
ncbi:hypothetical protein [Acrocarpospora sp. B8E8]|uniref:hypothetical protein n=1 Tax=Acrocarpospora sp. B8E8 TaxID=3153572 RepID=UPI00325DB973